MANERIDEFAAQLAPLGELDARRMFGGVGLRLDGVFFGLISGGELYFKVDDATRPAFEAAGSSPFRPTMKGGEVRTMGSYWRVPLEVEEDPRELRRWAGEALAAARRRDAAKGAKPARPARSKRRKRP